MPAYNCWVGQTNGFPNGNVTAQGVTDESLRTPMHIFVPEKNVKGYKYQLKCILRKNPTHLYSNHYNSNKAIVNSLAIYI